MGKLPTKPRPMTDVERTVATELLNSRDPWRSLYSGGASRKVSQAVRRLQSMGYVNYTIEGDAAVHRVTETGRAALALPAKAGGARP